LTTATLIATDRRTARALNNDRERLEVSRGVSQFGAVYTTGGIAAAFYFAGRASGDARARETGLLSLEALIERTTTLASAPVATGLKVRSQSCFPSSRQHIAEARAAMA
jgi:hypothetical protein